MKYATVAASPVVGGKVASVDDGPGAGRTTPPLSHDELVKALDAWVGAGMPCGSPASKK